MLCDGERTFLEKSLRGSQRRKDAIVTEGVLETCYLCRRLDMFSINLLKLLDVLQDCRELPRVCFHFLVGEAKPREFRNVPHLCETESCHADTEDSVPMSRIKNDEGGMMVARNLIFLVPSFVIHPS